MHLSVQFKHFNRAHWVAVQCEASEATPAVAEASEASGSYLYPYIYIYIYTMWFNTVKSS